MLRLLSRLPLTLLYPLAAALVFLACRVFGYRRDVTRENLLGAFADLDPVAREELQRASERQLGEVVAEVLKGLTMSRADTLERVAIGGLGALEVETAAGRSALIATAHCANWEWLLLGLSARLDAPLVALYKPLRSAAAERFFLSLRGRFGARLVPAKDVVGELAKPGPRPQVYAMVADQVPTSTPHRYWTRFLGRDTAFYQGIDDIARARGLIVYVLFAERTGRGRYRATLTELARPPYATLPPREIVRRYAAALEAHIEAHRADWLWGHRRWKLKKPLYGR
jgi:Kdo2-lipid IVA lauroyltransferase/acyltransferase